MELCSGFDTSIGPCWWATRTHAPAFRQISRAVVRGSSRGVWSALILLLNLGRMVSGLRNRGLRAHPERAPREAAALWYDRMVGRLARLGWRKLPSQTPLDFVAALREEGLQRKVERFYSGLCIRALWTVGG